MRWLVGWSSAAAGAAAIGSAGATGHDGETVHPIGSQLLWGDPDPLWAVGDWRPDVILTDVKMPGISGIELCRFLKSRYETAHVPVVLFSAVPPAELAGMARDCDADGYLSKVSGFVKLGEEISRLLDTVLF